MKEQPRERGRKIALGVDLGGTKVRAGLVDDSGRIVGIPESIPTEASADAEVIAYRIADLVKRTAAQVDATEIIGIGIGSTGPLDIDSGCILDCNNLPTMQNFPIRDYLAEATGLRVELNNDANALILGEALWGAGRGAERILGFTLGTGLGAAFVTRGRIMRGSADNAGEVWTSPYRDGIIEDYLSGTAVEKHYAAATGLTLRGEEIARRARMGEEAACAVWAMVADALAFTLAWSVNMFDPEAVILGGSVMNASDLFLAAAEEKMRRFLCPTTAAKVKIRKAELGADAGMAGAAALLHYPQNEQR